MAIRDTGLDCDFLITRNESLINRARNNLVATFMQTDYETLAFLDADIEISPEDFLKLVDMEGVRGAAVAMKHPNFFESLNVFKSGRQVTRSEMGSEPFRADFLGTAVLLLPRDLLASMALSLPQYVDPLIGPVTEYFPTYVKDGILLSEDYGFCEILRERDIPLWVEPSIVVNHYGSMCWSA